jgi:hypothetical protein
MTLFEKCFLMRKIKEKDLKTSFATKKTVKITSMLLLHAPIGAQCIDKEY